MDGPRTCRVALTGGIACGKSLLAKRLNELGVETLDADDVVHGLVPEEERRRLAGVVFRDAGARRALEARLHPLVRRRIDEWFAEGGAPFKVAVVPLLFEVQWERDYDIICCVVASGEEQVRRMTQLRGYTREEAEARLAAQMPVAEKAARSHYVICNDGSPEELSDKASGMVAFIRSTMEKERAGNGR